MSRLLEGVFAASGAGADYIIAGSLANLRNNSQEWRRNTTIAGNRQINTHSIWVKKTGNGLNQRIFWWRSNNNDNEWFSVAFTTADRIEVQLWSHAVATDSLFRDPTGWYHIVIRQDTTQALAANRLKIYVNGVEQTLITSLGSGISGWTQNLNTAVGTTAAQHRIMSSNGSDYIDGYWTEAHYVDGLSLGPDAFGETDITYGHWKPKEYTGSHGTIGYYIPTWKDWEDYELQSVTRTSTIATGAEVGDFSFTPQQARDESYRWYQSNTSIGQAFNVIQYDFGSIKKITGYNIKYLSFSGGVSTAVVQFSKDGVEWYTQRTLSITSSDQDFQEPNIANIKARYARIRMTAFGTNGRARIGFFGVSGGWLGEDFGNTNVSTIPSGVYNATQAIQRGADLTGNIDGKEGTISMWLNFSGTPSGSQALWIARDNATIGDTISMYRTVSNTIQFTLRNSSGTSLGTLTTPAITPGNLTHVLFTWDLAQQKIDVYFNGVAVNNITNATNGTVKYTVPNHGFGGNLFSPIAPNYVGTVAQLYVNYREYVTASEVARFYGGSNQAIYFGEYGDYPTDTQPIVYIRNMSSQDNTGYGGSFSQTGTPASGSAINSSGSLRNHAIGVTATYYTGWYGNFVFDSPTPATLSESRGIYCGNYPTWNNVWNTYNITPPSYFLSGLQITSNTSSGSNRTNVTQDFGTSGKYYWEFYVNNFTTNDSGYVWTYIKNITPTETQYNINTYVGFVHAYTAAGSPAPYGYLVALNGSTTASGSITAWSNTYTKVKFALDVSTRQLWYGTDQLGWVGGGNPATGTSPFATVPGTGKIILETWYRSSTGATQSFTWNFGQRDWWAGTIPAGFKPLCSATRQVTEIQPKSYFDEVTYTANNGGSQSISSLRFSPDLLWLKNRNGTTAYHGSLFDTTRGALRSLSTTRIDLAEQVETTGMVSFNSNGFSLNGTGSFYVNYGTDGYVGWCWDENPTAGFDIISYTGNGANRTIAHNLGAVPDAFVVKSRDSANRSWNWHFRGMPASNYILWEQNAGQATDTTKWNNTLPTSTTISLGPQAGVNTNGERYIGYLWRSIEGYSSIGYFTGNGSSDGTYVHTGFRPAWIMIKYLDGIGSWNLMGYKRVGYNVKNWTLYADTVTTEQGYEPLDICAQGFKLRSTNTGTNAFNSTNNLFVYMAFAEVPGNFANAR